DVSWFRNEAFQATMAAGRELELDYLNPLPYKVATEAEIRSVLGRLWEESEGIVGKIRRKLRPAQSASFEENDLYHEQVFTMDHKYLVGYWACEKYYADIMDLLRADITFPRSGDEALQKRNDEAIRQMEETVSVSVHIRRGDYLDDMNKALFGNICTEAYYERALGYMRERFPEAVFFIFSDDIPYVKEHYQGERYRIIDWNHGRDSFYDMMLMSRCKHNICANSTFSFWGARLNSHDDKVMIRPSIHKNTQVCVPEQMRELWNGWTLITPQGGQINGD
ncbi:MAG: alpha-1,2-fucosyltransferase, partial [Lachnospiraceae bacterium]|nr:alpha-1,2-fucosyltransferase [Lachnospiraceae bacterium]